MPRKDTKAEQTTIAIAELLGLASAPGRADPAMVQRARVAQNGANARPNGDKPEYSVLDDVAIQGLFDMLPDHLYVGRYLAASYLGCTQLTFERHIRARLEPGANWSKILGAQEPPSYRKGRFRWSFVREMRAYVAHAARQRPSRSKKRPEGDDGLLSFLEQHFPFLELDGVIQAGWGQGGVSAAEFKRLVRAGADVRRRSAVQALMMPWANPGLRRPWHDAVLELLARVEQGIRQGEAQASADGVTRAMPKKVKRAERDRRL